MVHCMIHCQYVVNLWYLLLFIDVLCLKCVLTFFIAHNNIS